MDGYQGRWYQGGSHTAAFRLVAHNTGQNRIWLVATGGQTQEEAVLRQLHYIDGKITASTVNAHNPDSDVYERMIMIQLPDDEDTEACSLTFAIVTAHSAILVATTA